MKLSDKRLSYSQNKLEKEVRLLFCRLGATCKKPSGNYADAILSFPKWFDAKLTIGNFKLQAKGSFVVEVKSAIKTGARIHHLRQLLEWLWRDQVKRNLLAERSNTLKDIRRLLREMDDTLRCVTEPAVSSWKNHSLDSLSEQNKDLSSRFSRYLDSLEITCKGLLVINPYLNKAHNNRPKPFRKNVRSFASSNGLLLITWYDLLCFEEMVNDGKISKLDFWCYLFKGSGIKHAHSIENINMSIKSYGLSLFDKRVFVTKPKIEFLLTI